MRAVYNYHVMDIVHRGHLLQMQNAKRMAGKDGISIVGILTDEAVMEKKPRPTLEFVERMNLAKIISYNDVVVAQDTYSPIPNIKKLKPDIVLESDSHKKEEIEEVRKVVESYGGRLFIMPYYPGISSTEIKEKVRKEK